MKQTFYSDAMLVVALLLPTQELPSGVCRIKPFTPLSDLPIILNFLPLHIAGVEEKGIRKEERVFH